MRLSVAAPPADKTVLLERRHPSNAPRWRTETGRDRDRILYSSAFLRLGNVTQVASPEAGHVFHSRLTHSLKVAQFARRLAEQLKQQAHGEGAAEAVNALDPDAAEACALAHDLGHPPFGHLAEQELDRKARSFGGFEGNAQSFRILTRLAIRSLDDPGLNLTRQTLNGVLKYPCLRTVIGSQPKKRWNLGGLLAKQPDPSIREKWGAYDADVDDFRWTRAYCRESAPSLEARIMDWADDVTYAVHDLDDFFRAGLIPLDRLCRGEEELIRFETYVTDKKPAAAHMVRPVFSSLGITTRYEGRVDERAQLRALGSQLITRYINGFRVVRSDDGVAVEIDDELLAQVAVLKQLVWFYIIERPSLSVVQAGQRRIIRGLVDLFMEAIDAHDLAILGPVYSERVEAQADDSARRRVVIDLVASMTEESAMEVYRRSIGVAHGSVLSAPRV